MSEYEEWGRERERVSARRGRARVRWGLLVALTLAVAVWGPSCTRQVVGFTCSEAHMMELYAEEMGG